MALVLGVVVSSFAIAKTTTIIRVYTSTSSSNDLDPSSFDESLCPTDHPEIVCARKIKDNSVIFIWTGGYYQGV